MFVLVAIPFLTIPLFKSERSQSLAAWVHAIMLEQSGRGPSILDNTGFITKQLEQLPAVFSFADPGPHAPGGFSEREIRPPRRTMVLSRFAIFQRMTAVRYIPRG